MGTITVNEARRQSRFLFNSIFSTNAQELAKRAFGGKNPSAGETLRFQANLLQQRFNFWKTVRLLEETQDDEVAGRTVKDMIKNKEELERSPQLLCIEPEEGGLFFSMLKDGVKVSTLCSLSDALADLLPFEEGLWASKISADSKGIFTTYSNASLGFYTLHEVAVRLDGKSPDFFQLEKEFPVINYMLVESGGQLLHDWSIWSFLELKATLDGNQVRAAPEHLQGQGALFHVRRMFAESFIDLDRFVEGEVLPEQIRMDCGVSGCPPYKYSFQVSLTREGQAVASAEAFYEAVSGRYFTPFSFKLSAGKLGFLLSSARKTEGLEAKYRSDS